MTTDDACPEDLPLMTIVPLKREQTRMTCLQQKAELNDKEEGETEDSDDEVGDHHVSEPFTKKPKRDNTQVAVDQLQTIRELAADAMTVEQCRAILTPLLIFDVVCIRCSAPFVAAEPDFILCDECTDTVLRTAMGE